MGMKGDDLMSEEKNLYITSVINIEKWDEAKWKGTLFMTNFKDPPYMGFVFQNKQAGIDIFKGWLDRFGKRDQNEEIRIAIIEGEIKGQDPGYTVHINTSIDHVADRILAEGHDFNEALFMTIGRCNRMNPSPNSKYLEMFKSEYSKHKRFMIIPAYINPKGEVEPMIEFSIEKTEVIFRNADEIKEGDIDYIVFKQW